ncbi:MAG: hypothetical protein LBR61_05290 [Synergistaceae bacterium]|nr:hypothetical protein [Synergistaceae bacterium]
MKRNSRFSAFAFVLALVLWTSGAASAASTNPYHFSWYQLRDVSGEKDGHTVAGSQWFATVTDWHWVDSAWVAYRDTDGGEAPEAPMVTSADLVSDFNGVYLKDPQDELAWGDDVSFDPIESVCLVITEGRGELNVNFGNNYAHHMPYGTSEPAMEDVLLSVPDYVTRVTPDTPTLVPGGSWLETNMRLQSESPQTYGSSLGYLTFRQSASFDTAFTGYRESIKIPLVVANVFDGPASEAGNELYFDMTVLNGTEPVTRQKFRWGAAQNMTRDMGTFFMILASSDAAPRYALRTRVTNRTGVRYRVQRYDNIGSGGYEEIWPQYWMYDLTPDLYATLPASFELDPQSQIAPGLITTYNSSMDMTYGSSESLRLYPYQGAAAPSDLRLTFRKVGGMLRQGTKSTTGATVTAFNMTFADVAENSDNTRAEIAKYAGGSPSMPVASFDFSGVYDRYIKADAISSFQIFVDMRDPSADVTASGDVVSSNDVPAVSSGVALLPVHIRMRVSRKEAPLVNQWDAIENADSVISALANICAVWVRSDATAERDMNLFTTLRNRGYSVERCVQAFTYEDFVYIDFIVLIADAVSQNTGKTAFCEVVQDDGVPYILIGDGAADGKIDLSFFVAPAGEAPSLDDPATPTTPVSPGSGGGGGCSGGIPAGAVLLLPVLSTILRRRRK